MKTIAIGQTSLRTSQICLGTADWGSRSGDDLDRLYSAYRAAGGNCSDSAHCYAFWAGQLGTPERLLGQLVRKHDKREDVIICSKGCHITCGPKYERPARYMTPQLLASDLRDNLDRLQMDYIDLYYLHRDDPQVPVDEILDALHDHQQAGRIRAYAASNWRADRLAQARDYAHRKGYQGFAASQILFNLGHLAKPMPPDLCVMDETQMPWYGKTRMPLFAFSSTANGYFASGTHGSYDCEISAARRERAIQLARKLGATPNQVALAYLMAQPFPVIPIVGTLKLDHLQDAIGATKLRLSGADLRWLQNG